MTTRAAAIAPTIDDDGIATITLRRGKVNALVPEVVDGLRETLDSVRETGARAIVLTGSGAFFSFGFDVPHMLEWPRDRFRQFLCGFCDLYRAMFVLPLPVVAAINGHAIAGGCMLALAADARVMARGGAKISLNEFTFGASVFAGFVEMLRFHVDGRTASRLLCRGEMLRADEAASMGIVDCVAEPADVLDTALSLARAMCRNLEAFSSIKRLLRHDVGERMNAVEDASIDAFLDVWYSSATRSQLAKITIR